MEDETANANGDTTLAAQAFTAWSNLVNFSFQSASPSTSSLNIVEGILPATAYGRASQLYTEGGVQKQGIVISNVITYGAITKAFTYLHEIGHGIGLGHIVADRSVSIMADGDAPNASGKPLPTGPMILDIKALHTLYPTEINYSYKDDNDTYGDGSSKTWTIWDGGGTSDTITAAGQTISATIDLRGGMKAGNTDAYWSHIGNEWISIAYDPNHFSGVIAIERAVGGSAGDSIYGGGINNPELRGNGGNDTIWGDGDKGVGMFFGGDTIYGDAGADTLYGDNGQNTLAGSSATVGGADSIYGGADNDKIYGEGANDTLYGEAGLDTLYGGQGADSISGGTEDDVIYGGLDGDVLYGDNGNDRVYAYDSIAGENDSSINFLYGGEGNDTISGGAGADILDGGTGSDLIKGGAGTDVFNIQGNEYSEIDTIDGGAGWDVVNVPLTGWAHYSIQDSDGKIVLDFNYPTMTDDSYYSDHSIDPWNNEPGEEFWSFGESGYLEQLSSEWIGADHRNPDIYRAWSTLDDGHFSFDFTNVASDFNVTGSNGRLYISYTPESQDLQGSATGDTLTPTSYHKSVSGGAGGDTFVLTRNLDTEITIADFSYSQGDRINLVAFDGQISGLSQLGLTGVSDTQFQLGTPNTTVSLQGVATSQVNASYFLSNTLNYGAGVTFYGDTVLGDTIVGTSANDAYYGNQGNDSINGGTGNDTIYGWTDSDTLHGSYGQDFIGGDQGNDYLSGEGGNDTLDGGTGNDSMYGGGGDDTYYVDSASDVVAESATLDNGASNDSIDTVISTISYTLNDTGVEHVTLLGTAALNAIGDYSDNILTGNDGNNTLAGKGGADTLIGGAGFDTASYASATGSITLNLTLGGTLGEAIGDTFDGIEFVVGSSYGDFIAGSEVYNYLNGGAGNDTLNGWDGDDTFNGGTGADSINGGNGNDMVDYSGSAGGVSVNIFLDTNTALDGTGSTDTLSSIENVYGSNTGNDTIYGSNAANALYGNGGNDGIYAYGGNDTIHGGAGNDTMGGGAGDDSYYVDSASDSVLENASEGTDTIYSSITLSSLATHVENLTLTGTANLNAIGNSGANVLTGNDGNNIFYYSAGADTFVGGAGYDTVNLSGSGSSLNMTLTTTQFDGTEAFIATSGNDTITGRDIGDYLSGLGGNDNLSGGDGNDTISGGAGVDTITGGNGSDMVDYSAASAGVNVNLWTGVVSNDGQGSSDTLTSIESAYGSAYNDAIYGTAGDNMLYGNGGNDGLYCYGGNDTMNGGAGNDTMGGGADDDIFFFAHNEGNDTITDFGGAGVAGGDVIQLYQTTYSSIAVMGGNTVVTLAAGNTITLAGVTGLTADDFLIS